MSAAWRPRPSQERLLEAALLPAGPAAEALQAWQQAVDLETLDSESSRLLPMLASRLDAPGIEPELRGLIQGAARRTWYDNQRLLAQGRELAGRMTTAGIPVMLLKGAALALRHYGDVGARSMGDLDLAVPAEHAQQAVQVLVEAGWTPGPSPLTVPRRQGAGEPPGGRSRHHPVEAFDRWYLGVRHSHNFEGPNGLAIDLHWHLFRKQYDAAADRHAWETAVPIDEAPGALRTLADPEHLLLVLVHASVWTPVPLVRWVADAVMVLRHAPGFDWDDFVNRAIGRQATLVAGPMLGYLDGRFGVRVPAEVLTRLQQHPIPGEVRRAHRQASRPVPLMPVSELGFLYERYRALRRESAPAGAPGFIAFLGNIWGVDHPMQVLNYVGIKGWRWLRGPR